MGLLPPGVTRHVVLPRRSGSAQVVGEPTVVVTVTPDPIDIARPTTCPSVSSCRPSELNRISAVPAEFVTCWPVMPAPSVRLVTVVAPSLALASLPVAVYDSVSGPSLVVLPRLS